MSNLESLLQQLADNNVKLKVENGKIKFQDPGKFVKGEILEFIKVHKPDIIALLNKNLVNKSIASQFVAGGEIPVSKIQQPLLFAECLTDKDFSHNLWLSYRYAKEVTVEKLVASLRSVIEKNESLRLGYTLVNGRWKARLNPVNDLEIECFSLNEQELINQYGSLNAYARKFIRRKFEFDGTPLTRVRVVKLDNDDVLLTLSSHHVICDGLSMLNLSRKIDAQLFEPESVDELYAGSASYLDYLAWQEKREYSDGMAYWQKKLEDVPNYLSLPTDFARPTNGVFNASTSQLNLEPSIVERLQSLSKAQKVSHFTILLATFYCLLSRYSSQNDIVVGIPFSNRDQPEIVNTLGLFINTLPVRAKLQEQMSFEDLLEHVSVNVREATSHQNTPLVDIIEIVNPSRSASYSPLFQVLVNYLDIQGGTTNSFNSFKSEVAANKVEEIETKYDLTLNITNKDGKFNFTFEYSNTLFMPATIKRLKAHYVQLLSNLLDNPKAGIRSHSILTEDDFSFLKDVNATKKELGPLKNPYECIREFAQSAPNRTAIVFDTGNLTFAEFNARIETVAAELKQSGVTKGDRIGLYFVRSPDMVCAIYACFKLGAIYVPLDPSYPSNRIKYIISDTELTCVLSTSILEPLISKLELAIPTILVDNIGQISSPDVETIKLTEHDSAYIIHTSGTTGNPKGVNVSHGNLHNLMSGLDQTFGDGTKQTWLAQTSINFDISIVELVWTFTRGHKVVLQQSRNVDLVNVDTKNTRKPLEFSIMFFSEDSKDDKKYDLMLNSSVYADQNGFNAVWLPERHFGEFGGAFANPSITCAALSTVTQNLNLRAGSVVLPLHDPIRVAEEWSMIDNLSNGRVGLAFATGWHPNDFVFEGADFKGRREQLKEKLSQLQSLWKGDAIKRVNGLGNAQDVIIRPTPKQKSLPTWITAAGNSETFRYAGTIGANVLTHMLGQSIEKLEENIAIYHQVLIENGFSTDDKEITLMLHTYLDKSVDIAFNTAEAPFKKYLESSINLIAPIAEELGLDLAENKDAVIDIAFDRLCRTNTLFGTAESCQDFLNTLHKIGVTEIASLIDFGVESAKALESLQRIGAANDIYRGDWLLAKRLSKANYKSELELIHEHDVTHVQMTPSQLKILLKQHEIDPKDLSVTRWLIGGENLTRNLVEQLKNVSTGRCYNMYGPTETTVWSAWCDVTESEVVIGKPCINTDFYLLDQSQQLVPVGVVGELHIGGMGVSKGYWNKSDLTEKAFKDIDLADFPSESIYKTGDLMKMLDDGRCQYVGRVDDQIKINGYRIELNEIEQNLLRIPGIKDCRVVVKAKSENERTLAAYVVESDNVVCEVDIRNRLLEVLPGFMIPNEINTIEKIPLLGNGKIDHATLKSLESKRVEKQSTNFATNENDMRMATLWCNILEREACPIDVSFFELGGNSLRIVSLHAQIQDEFEIEVKIVDLFKYKTIREQAEFVKLHLQDNAIPNNRKPVRTRERKAIPKRRKQSVITD